MRFLGKWLFRLYLFAIAVPRVFFEAAVAAVERIAGWSYVPWGTRVVDRLLANGDVVCCLVVSFIDTFEQTEDGPGWSVQQIPRLWTTCHSLAQKMGCPPPDAIHLSVEPGMLCAWMSGGHGKPLRRHIALSLLDLRLLSHDEARAIIAHEIAHVRFDHPQRDHPRPEDRRADGCRARRSRRRSGCRYGCAGRCSPPA